jgi:hypothetical protein
VTLGTKMATARSKVPPDAVCDNFLLFCLLLAQCIDGAKKVATNMAPQLFCSANVVGSAAELVQICLYHAIIFWYYQ